MPIAKNEQNTLNPNNQKKVREYFMMNSYTGILSSVASITEMAINENAINTALYRSIVSRKSIHSWLAINVWADAMRLGSVDMTTNASISNVIGSKSTPKRAHKNLNRLCGLGCEVGN